MEWTPQKKQLATWNIADLSGSVECSRTAALAHFVSVRASFDRILQNWLPLTYALNELNRGMGLPDLYPFVLSAPAIEKLGFVHEVLNVRAQG
jgi:hypothetical protein